jgi:hypothetical protein
MLKLTGKIYNQNIIKLNKKTTRIFSNYSYYLEYMNNKGKINRAYFDANNPVKLSNKTTKKIIIYSP